MTTIPTVRYVPGDLRAVVWPGGVVLLDSSVSAAVATATWERLRNLQVPSTLDAVLTEVAEAIGARLLDLPPFAIAVTTGPAAAHVATRGHFEIEATSADLSTARVTGTGVATWSERQLMSVVRMRISAGAATAQGDELPVGSAVVGAQVVVVAEATAAAAVSPAPADELDEFGDPKDPDRTSRADDSGHWVNLADGLAADAPAAEPEPIAEPIPEPIPDPIPEPAAAPPPEPAPNGFDDVWSDYTLAGSVEGAAVRPGAEVPASPPPPPSSEVRSPASAEVTWLEDESRVVDEPVAPDAPPPMPAEGLPPTPPPTLPPPGDFISSVPGMPPIPPPVAPPPAQAPPVPSSAFPPQVAPPSFGDHDGDTIAGPARPAALAGAPGLGPEDGVLGVLCPSGHGNPPQRARCRVCGSALTGAPTRIPPPSLGRVIVSSGEEAELSGPVIIGRAPRASRFQGTSVPRLVTLHHPHISGSHMALRVEGWSVLAVDLSSTNGTFLRRNGQPPFRILDQPQLLVEGDVIDLGHGVHLRFEELP